MPKPTGQSPTLKAGLAVLVLPTMTPALMITVRVTGGDALTSSSVFSG
jgi:hypothetical protein